MAYFSINWSGWRGAFDGPDSRSSAPAVHGLWSTKGSLCRWLDGHRNWGNVAAWTISFLLSSGPTGNSGDDLDHGSYRRRTRSDIRRRRSGANCEIAGFVGGLGGLVLVIDEAMQYWSTYLDLIPLKTGFVSTIGAVTPTIGREENMWLSLLDSYAHLILPTAALMIVSVAGYTRYARASLLEV